MSTEEMNLQELESQFSEQESLRREKLVKLQEEGKDPFDVYKVKRTHSSKQVKDNFEELEGKEVTVAGRIMSKRGQGKVVFSDIYDRDGKIQLFIKIDEVGEEALKQYKTNDLGDWVAATGEVFKTKTGEVSVKVKTVELISKSLKPLPEKWHGLKDPDLRYRQREVDIITNPEVKDTFIKRSQIISGIRTFLDNRGFLEVETPMLATIAGGASARPFITHHNTLDLDMFLRIAPELYLKRCIVAGFEKVYELGRTFRNEGMSVRHNPEFTMIELYQAFADYNDMMELTENMVAEVCKKVNGTTKVTYQGAEIDFMPPWRRITMVDAVKEYAGVDYNEFKSDADAQAVAKEKNLEFSKPLNTVTKGEVLNALYEEFCEEHMIQPTFIIDYPVEISPLTKKKRGNEMFTERFEGFVFGRELCNAYSELNDPIVQRERFAQQEKERELGDDEAYMIDEEFMSALETGMPPTGGLGIGIDRLIMFLTDSASIRDVILFPTMKPLNNN
ncbi:MULTISPECIES: lysine--tRNA ligase [Clostridia]|jgi:lysyl-tRNA synthetase class 2|uniref:Lysine--tRNA ligase n=2 Tax=Clostridia TaxID=186801 RepID=A0A8I0A7G1_9CLOT|nr:MULTISPECIES: lysine--tRNA ligase [Clostridia]MBC5640979.1 lysine--tRNA ligase [Clostridium lentum]MBC5655167.1 lysine--tRNA ligase [Blautia lenta]MEE0567888.1 lysine--tRNA ligase [Clostridium sp.]OKZ86872.1 MAG: lysine--tRNA ligase [Clostridium sp. 29_15]CDB74072.1 lysine--tRNA ligase [Clostridium sp. CAG:265]